MIHDKEIAGLPEPARSSLRAQIQDYFRNGYDLRFLSLRRSRHSEWYINYDAEAATEAFLEPVPLQQRGRLRAELKTWTGCKYELQFLLLEQEDGAYRIAYDLQRHRSTLLDRTPVPERDKIADEIDQIISRPGRELRFYTVTRGGRLLYDYEAVEQAVMYDFFKAEDPMKNR